MKLSSQLMCVIAALVLASTPTTYAQKSITDFGNQIVGGVTGLGDQIAGGATDAANEVASQASSLGNEIEDAFEETGEEIEDFGDELEQFARDAGDLLTREVLEPIGDSFLDQHGNLLSRTVENWNQAVEQDREGNERLAEAVRNQDAAGALRALGQLMATNTGMRKIVENGREGNMGSLLLMAGGGGGVGVGGGGAVGFAIDIESLHRYVETGRFPSDRVVLSQFVTVGGNIGISGGAAVGIGIGYNLNTPDGIHGPAIDFMVELSAAAGAGIALSCDPSDGMNVVACAISVSVGAEGSLAGGISYTHVLSQVPRDTPFAPITRPLSVATANGLFRIEGDRLLHVDPNTMQVVKSDTGWSNARHMTVSGDNLLIIRGDQLVRLKTNNFRHFSVISTNWESVGEGIGVVFLGFEPTLELQ